MIETLKRAIRYAFDGPNYVTWVTHGVLAFLLAWLVNPPAAVTAYVWRAGSHIAYAYGNGSPLKLGDRAMDVGIPTVVAVLVWLIP